MVVRGLQMLQQTLCCLNSVGTGEVFFLLALSLFFFFFITEDLFPLGTPQSISPYINP